MEYRKDYAFPIFSQHTLNLRHWHLSPLNTAHFTATSPSTHRIIIISNAPGKTSLSDYLGRWGIEIDHPYNLRKPFDGELRHRRRPSTAVSCGSPQPQLCQLLRVGFNQPQRMARRFHLARLKQATA